MDHILAVGNDIEGLDKLKTMLIDRYQISLGYSCDSVLWYLDHYKIDLLLVTWDFCAANDYFLGKLLKKKVEEEKLLYLVLVDSPSNEEVKRVYHYGAIDVIEKNSSSEVMLRRVANYLELQHYQKEYIQRGHLQDTISVIFAEMVEFRDEATGGHCRNTTLYFKILLEAIIKDERYKDKISPIDFTDLLRSAPLHDIGKLGINDEVLRKSSPLDYQEYEHIKTHTIIARDAFEKIMKETGEMTWLMMARDIAYCHHERWNGTGYPNGLIGEEIPLSARILMIVDVYDALTSKRSYKEPYSHQKAMDIIVEGKNTKFDPVLVDIFVTLNDSIEKALHQK